MRAAERRRLQECERRLHQLGAELPPSGFIRPGSVTCRYAACGKPNCHCHADPPQLHGPYWQWTTKVGGRTVCRNLTESQALLYKEWIANRRRLLEILRQLEDISEEAAEILLQHAKQNDQAPSAT